MITNDCLLIKVVLYLQIEVYVCVHTIEMELNNKTMQTIIMIKYAGCLLVLLTLATIIKHSLMSLCVMTCGNSPLAIDYSS